MNNVSKVEVNIHINNRNIMNVSFRTKTTKIA